MSWVGKRRRAKPLTDSEARTANAPLHQLSWQEFEQQDDDSKADSKTI